MFMSVSFVSPGQPGNMQVVHHHYCQKRKKQVVSHTGYIFILYRLPMFYGKPVFLMVQQQ